MKITTTVRSIVLTVIAAGGLVTAFTAQAQYLNTFDTGFAPWRFDYGTATAIANNSVTFGAGPTFDANGNAGSGSARLGWLWDHNADGDGSAAFTADIIGSPGQSYVGGTLAFDIYLDPTSTSGDFNDYGYFQVVTRNTDGYSFNDTGVGNGLINFAVAPGQWSHVSVSLDATDGNLIRAITLQDYNDAGRAIVGPMAIYIDNLQITPVPEPSTFALLGVGSLLLALRRRK